MAGKPDIPGIDRIGATLAIDAAVGKVKQVSAGRARALSKMGITTVRGLLANYPRRYLDMSHVTTIAQARIGESCTICANVHEVKVKRPRPNLPLAEVTLVDGTGTLVVTAFRQPWLADQLKAKTGVAVSGEVQFNYGFKRMTNPHIEVLEEEGSSRGKIVPVHPLAAPIKAGMMRRLVLNALEMTRGAIDPLPLALRVKYQLMSRNSALNSIHFPRAMCEQEQARRRLAYEEVLLLELMLMSEGRARAKGRAAVSHVIDGPKLAALAEAIPFKLTDEQARARDDILTRMADERAADHMVLGDVGTGKTIVAAHALAAAADSGGQALFMAPTEILARQHGAALGPLLDEAGVTWDVLTGSTPSEERAELLGRLKEQRLSVVFGTHALLEPDVAAPACSLVVVDEQQRFGVGQREALIAKGDCPDVIYLTATPIPRTLALALFGNLTLSYIRQRPHDTAPRTTAVHTLADRGLAYDAALAACQRGEQVYVVCPLVGEKRAGEEAKRGDEDAYEFADIRIEDERDMEATSVSAAESHAAFLREKVFAGFKVGLLHGKLPTAEKQQVMERFRAGEISVLVATTVIEVGVDVKRATVMIVEDAERFGLSQLHQLRGRVGRGELPGEFHLVSGTKSEAALSRLSALARTEDGFELASYDLSLRREGDILGNRQHGASLLKLVNVVRDSALIEAAHADAAAILEEDPGLETEQYRPLAREARIMYRSAEEAGRLRETGA